MDYNLSGLAPRSFERLVQALSTKVIGPGVVVFGDGPDGGREATFEGKYPFPSSADPWSGYCVLQAKFLQRPRNPSSDAKWLLQQVERELRVYARGKRRPPKYYIVATNVVLSAVEKRGGKDRLSSLMRKYRSRVPIADSRIWDFDQITTYLDSFADIRTAYGAWITSGDVLAAVMQHIVTSRTDFDEVMTNFLTKELLADQFVNLDQAGHATEDKIALSRVFVDLPTTSERFADPPQERGVPVLDFASHMVSVSKERLDPTSVDDVRSAGERALLETGRYVLLGGPGQGKTTLAQFVCQLFRTALLEGRPKPRLSAEARATLEGILEQCVEEGVQLPQARRFPIRIVLSEFAKALSAARSEGLSVLAYIVRLIRRRTDHSVTTDDLRRWLSAYPWIVILDGLDEVPASTNRTALLDAVREFVVDAAQANADLLLIATSRPQGYAHDFSRKHYQHLWLAPLSEKRSLAYARRFVHVRYGSEEDRQEKIITRLRHALRQDATARLMRSPLLVTIMATLVDQIGRPPQDRWRLFHDYYEVIYRREMERDIPAADLLRDHRANLDTIHNRVGLLLQVASERAGGTEARLPLALFGEIVSERLSEEGYAGLELAKLRDRIIDAAANRLVFLVGIEEGVVGFEIRSLQEFMAAEALMAGNDESIKGRLRRIGAAMGWRNAFLFAAGRCFAEVQHLREAVFTIASELNDRVTGELGAAVLSGSHLALDLLEDGLARRAPRFARLFARLALDLLDLAPSDVHVQLAGTCDSDIESLFREELTTRISRGQAAQHLGAWSTLLAMVGQRKWAEELASLHWPTDRDEQLALMGLPSGWRAREWLRTRAVDVLAAMPPVRGWRAWRLLDVPRPPRRPKTIFEALFDVRSRRFRDHGQVTVRLDGRGTGWPVGHATLSEIASFTEGIAFDWADFHPGWTAIAEGIQLARNPNSKTLADALERSAEADALYTGPPGAYLCPWVFVAIVKAAGDAAGLRTAAEAVRSGRFGDVANWREAEARWKDVGITAEDILYKPEGGQPFDAYIGQRGCPWSALTIYGHRGNPSADVGRMVELFARLPQDNKWRGALAEMVLGALQWDDTVSIPTALRPSVLKEMLALAPLSYPDPLIASIAEQPSTVEWVDVLDAIGSQTYLITQRMMPLKASEIAKGAKMLGEFGLAHPDRVGLPRLCAAFAEHLELSTIAALALALRAQTAPTTAIHRKAWAMSSIVLRLAADGEDDSADSLARLTVDVHTRENRLMEEVLGSIERMELFTGRTNRYLLELNRLIGDTEAAERTALYEALRSCLEHQTSGLYDTEVWAELKLPRDLLLIASHGTGASEA